MYKLRLINSKLRELVETSRFSSYEQSTQNIAEVTNCYLNNEEKCKEKAYCVTTEEGLFC